MVITTFLSVEKWEKGILDPDPLPEESFVRMLKPDLSKYA